MNYSELLQLARFGVIFYNYQRVIIWRLRFNAILKGLAALAQDLILRLMRQPHSLDHMSILHW